ncbi:MAG: class I SAM-dependent methyltransferase [Patescibacteria group bacterium]
MLDSNFWNKYFKVYDILNLVISYQELLSEIIKESEIKKDNLVLDAGGGTGNLSLLLEKEGAKVINLDFSKEALNIYKKKNKNAQIIFHDLTQKIPFPDNHFDKIVSNNTLYNIPREKRLDVMIELRRVLKPKGEIVIANIHKNFKPIKIYYDTIKENIKREGIFNTIKLILKMFIPTIKMFYYNFIIQKEHKFNKNNLFNFNEQKELLEKAGFKNISETKLVYVSQGILNSAIKP